MCVGLASAVAVRGRVQNVCRVSQRCSCERGGAG